MPPRCPRGSRRNKKTGNCETTTHTQKQKRCSKGTRRNKKTGACEQKSKLIASAQKEKTVTSKQKENTMNARNAQFYDIADAVTPGYDDREMLTKEEGKTLTTRVKAYLQQHPNIQYGDIIFLGSTYETRQEYGFRMVLDDGDTLADDYVLNLPFSKRV